MKQMGRLKRLPALLLAFLTAFATLPAAAAYAAPDIAGHWAEPVLQKWIDDGSLSGYGGGVYRPDASITRAEFMALVNRAKGYGGESADIAKYGDVSPDDWYYGAVSSALAAGYIAGTGETEMSPEKPITRQEAMAIIARVENIAPSGDFAVLAGTNDGESAAAWAKGYVAAAVENGLIGGANGNVSPFARITRAETVTLLDRVESGARTYAFAGDFGPAEGTRTIGSAVLSASGANLKNTTVTGDLSIADSVGNGDVTLTNIKVNGDLYVNGGGANTILFNNVDVLGSLVVNKAGGGVRILATGSTNVRLTVLESGAILVERDLTGGGFERVEIAAGLTAGQPVVLEGQFASVENGAADLDLTINGRVNELISSENLTVKGTGVIAKLTPADGAVIKNETTETAPATGGGSGGGSGGNSSGTGGNGAEVAVSAVALEPAALRVQVGKTAALTATLSPANASDKSLTWTSSDSAVASVANGLVTGVAPGSAVITATAAGGKTATANAEVVPAHVGAKLSKFDAEAATEGFSTGVSAAKDILKNGASVSVGVLRRGAGTNEYYAYIGGADTDTDKPVPVVLTVMGADGAPVEDIGKFALTLPQSGVKKLSGEYLADAAVASGSAILLLDFSVATSHTVNVGAADHTPLSLTLYFVPQGGTTLDAVTVKGDAVAGGTLAADAVTAGGAPKESGFAYQWLRSRYADEGYTPISGATAASYSPVEADKGYYIRLKVTGDGSALYGEALSAAKGPIVSITDEVFAAIEAAYLGENESANYVTKNLNLMKSLAAYPGLTIAWTAIPADAVNADTGAVTRPESGDAQVKLTATLSGLAMASRDFEINVLMRGIENVEQKGTDARFKPGYPRSFVKDGNIWVEFELTEAAQVYLLVNVDNAHIETTDPQIVLNGHVGNAGRLVWLHDSPVFFAKANEKISYDTTYGFMSGQEARLDFALTDRNDRAQRVGEVVTIHYDAATVSELDEDAPRPQRAFLNAAGDKIYLYFNEAIESKGLAGSDFSLSVGTVVSAGIRNYSGAAVADYKGEPVASYVELGVTGVDASNRNALTLHYDGGTVTDASSSKNAVAAFPSAEYDGKIQSAATSITGAYIGNDGKTLRVEVKGGPNMEEYRANYDEWTDLKSRFSIEGAPAVPEEVGMSYQIGGVSFVLKFDTALIGAPNVRYDMTSLPNWAYDANETAESVVTEDMTNKASVEKVSYSTAAKQFTVTCAADLIIEKGSFIADGFTATIDGKAYRLRGFNAHSWGGNAFAFVISLNPANQDSIANDAYLQSVAGLIENAQSVTLSFDLVHGTSYHNQIRDIGGALLPAFGPQAVTVMN